MTKVNGHTSWITTEELFERTFGDSSLATRFALLKNVERERPEVKEFVDRAFRIMAVSKTPPQNFTPGLAWILGVMMPGMLPGAWGNIIPPITYEDRHLLINQYLANNPWAKFPEGSVLLEMGCGFPPQTAIDVAREFPQWQVIGADLRFDPYVVYDVEGNYACMDHAGDVRYFQPGAGNRTSFQNLYGEKEATHQRFANLFARMREKLPSDHGDAHAEVEHEGARLVANPIRSYERTNLRLMETALGEDAPAADIIRVFNVLFYFDSAFRRRAEEWALRTLRPGGLFLCGGDGAKTLECRYSVYRKEQDTLVRKEFAFSIDNIRPPTVLPFFCLHDQERETFELATLLGVLNTNEKFHRAYNSRLDQLLAEKKMWVRQPDGFLGLPAVQLDPVEWMAEIIVIHKRMAEEGFVDEAVAVLESAGYHAWKNPVGHVAVDPATM